MTTGTRLPLLLQTLALATLSLGAANCVTTYDSATNDCTQGYAGDPDRLGQGGFSGPGLEGCRVGAIEIGPRFHDKADSDPACARRFDPSARPFEDTQEWMDWQTATIDRRSGCEFGAAHALRYRPGEAPSASVSDSGSGSEQ